MDAPSPVPSCDGFLVASMFVRLLMVDFRWFDHCIIMISVKHRVYWDDHMFSVGKCLFVCVSVDWRVNI